ncbi:MAG TPA: hypothetical protein VF331_27660 [Polyangiales bacterium]
MALRPRTFGLSVAGATAAANAAGRDFEDAVGTFSAYLSASHGTRFVLSKDFGALPVEDARRLRQFFALCSAELQQARPPSPRFGDIYRSPPDQPVMIFGDDSSWREAEEGIEPDRVLFDTQTRRLVLIEAKYGDTEGNAHIERAGARATPSFLAHLERLFGGRARYCYVFSGPMITARTQNHGPKIGQRGARKGTVVQTPQKRAYASARYHRQIEVLFAVPNAWTMLWDSRGLECLIRLFEGEIHEFLTKP